MRMTMKGINSITKRLADGTTRTYWYAWKSGPPLRGEPGSLEFVAAYTEACARKVVPANGTLLSLLNEYQASTDFTELAASTRRSYIALIKRIEKKFAAFPLAAMTDRRTRGIFKQWRDKIAVNSGLRQADYAWTVLARVLSWGLDLRKIDANPCERGGRLYDADRSDDIWTDAQEAAFLESAPGHLHLPIMLALWTGQAQGDLLRLPWSSYDGKLLHFRRRGKTKVRIPPFRAGAPLKAMLDATPRKSPIILVNSDGKPWTSDGFRASWRKACAKAGVVDLTFHDLRGTAVTRLATVGCTVPEIATITGHSLRSVQAILDKHYLNRNPVMAESAITKLESRKVVGSEENTLATKSPN